MLRVLLAVLIVALLLPAPAAGGRDRHASIPGPVEAELISVIDGDTLLVEARPWPQHSVTVLVRLRGIDAPELRAKCQTARQAAIRARTALAALVEGGVRLTNIAGDKYFGRVVADVSGPDDANYAGQLLALGLVRPYDGGRRPQQDC